VSTPAEQIERFIKAHPGEWRVRYPGDLDGDMVLETVVGWLVLCPHGGRVSVTASKRGPDEADFCATDKEEGLPILTQAAARFAELCQAYNVPAEGMPPWLADPVRRHLRTRAGELLTLAGSSPADVVSAAETVDEALCGRPVVEVTGILPALMAIGMSCRWATGADEAADDYIGFVSQRLDVVAGERDGLRAAIVQALADLDAYDRSDGRQATAPLSARAVLRRALGVT